MKRSPLRKKSRGTFKHRAWEVFSKYIRQRNADESGMVSCISCGTVKHWKEIDAGHYIAKSLSLALRFDERNVHPQCVACNKWRHGNPSQYALALIRRYGENILEELDRDRRSGEGFKIYESGYRELFEKYKAKINED
jgi:hypothetical protein